MRYACLVGADRKTVKETELEELKEEEASQFISGYYYSKGFHYQTYKPELVLTDRTFLHYCLPVTERLYNDCLIHSVNFAMRHPWFTCREQVVRLMHKRMKKGDMSLAQEFKTESGVRINHMKDFFLDGSVSYSLEQVASYSREEGGVVQGFEAFLNQRLRGPGADMNEVIAVGMALGEEVPYTHAFTILAQSKDGNLIISDSAADLLGCWPAKPPGYGDKPPFKARRPD
jgi:hypothetical protein